MLTYHFLAFIDILGFSSMVEADCNGPQEEISFLPKLLALHDQTALDIPDGNGVTFSQFSDSVIVAQRYTLNTFSAFARHVMKYQRSLFFAGVLCRGGLSYGKHYEKENFVFSEALIKAYRIENERAKYPRIVIDDDLLDLLSPVDGIPESTITKEADGASFLDYLRDCDREDGLRAVNELTEGWETKPLRVREKLGWLREYFSFSFSDPDSFHVQRFRRV